ncbi:MAG: hypothetical protein IPK68_10610 [Bdellovibrionales bacterium]|nr:hypothetical protein [Bdellovibrionales bacterium]
MKRTGACYSIIIAGVLLGSFGCEKNAPSFSLLPDSEIFFQNSGAVSPKIDLLWVVDNSGSMHSSQVNVANNFSSFISDFSSRGFDYRMAVVATDAYRQLFTGSPTVSLFKSAGGTSIITPSTPDINNVFIDNIMVGTAGYGDERALQSIKVAMDNPSNSGLLRSDSFLQSSLLEMKTIFRTMVATTLKINIWRTLTLFTSNITAPKITLSQNIWSTLRLSPDLLELQNALALTQSL